MTISTRCAKDRTGVLLIEDDEDDFLITEDLPADIGEDQFELVWVPTFDLGREAIAKGAVDIGLSTAGSGTRLRCSGPRTG